MLFSVIYEFDCPVDVSVKRFMPSQRKLFDLTERSDGEPSDWCGDLWDGKCRHRKLCAMLTREQFERFLGDTGLFAEDVETMGSLGAPGFGFGWAPAISFRNDDEYAIQSAYVTPMPGVRTIKQFRDKERKRPLDENDWDRVRKAVIKQYS